MGDSSGGWTKVERPNCSGQDRRTEHNSAVDWQHLMAQVTFAFIFRASVTCEFLEPQPSPENHVRSSEQQRQQQRQEEQEQDILLSNRAALWVGL